MQERYEAPYFWGEFHSAFAGTWVYKSIEQSVQQQPALEEHGRITSREKKKKDFTANETVQYSLGGMWVRLFLDTI